MKQRNELAPLKSTDVNNLFELLSNIFSTNQQVRQNSEKLLLEAELRTGFLSCLMVKLLLFEYIRKLFSLIMLFLIILDFLHRFVSRIPSTNIGKRIVISKN
jgi:hypothetical protein